MYKQNTFEQDMLVNTKLYNTIQKIIYPIQSTQYPCFKKERKKKVGVGGSSLQEGPNLVVSGTNASWTCDDDDDDDADLCTASKILAEATYLVNALKTRTG